MARVPGRNVTLARMSSRAHWLIVVARHLMLPSLSDVLVTGAKGNRTKEGNRTRNRYFGILIMNDIQL